jgi:flavorubredoxin
MNSWLAAAPHAQVAHGKMGCLVQVNDLADRPPRPLSDGEVIDLGGRRVRRIETPHVPHGWDAGLFLEETTGTLLCGDLFTTFGDTPALTEHDIVGPALKTEDAVRATCLTPATAPTIRALADLQPTSLGLMHGPAFTGDCAQHSGTCRTPMTSDWTLRHPAERPQTPTQLRPRKVTTINR